MASGPIAAAAKSLQSCLILCDPVDVSPSGSPAPGILQARTLEWLAISFSNAWMWKVKRKSLSRVRLFATPWTAAYQAPRWHHLYGRKWRRTKEPLNESESCCCCSVASAVSDCVWPHRWQPTSLPCPWDSPGKNTGVGCHFLFQCMNVKSESEVAQSCPTLSDPMDCSLSGSSIHGIFQVWVLEWGAIAFSIFSVSEALK